MMSKLSLLDKLKVLGSITSSSGLFVVAIVILIALAWLLIATSTRTKKVSKFICIAIYGSIILVSLIFYSKELSGMFDYMMNNFFIAIYFPNLAIYFAAIIATNIILWISIFNRNITKWIRTINTIIFCIIHYLLILVINVIITNKLNILDMASIYKNESALALIELSSTIFIFWILFLIIYKIIRIYQQKELPAEPLVKKEEIIPKNQTSEPVIKKEIVYKRKLPDSIVKTEVPSIIYTTSKKDKKIKEEPPSIIDFMNQQIENENSYLRDIPNFITDDSPQFLDMMLGNSIVKQEGKRKHQETKNQINLIEEPAIVMKNTSVPKEPVVKKEETDIFDNLLTLEDYKRVLALLKNYKNQSIQQEKYHENNEISMTNLQQLIGRK